VKPTCFVGVDLGAGDKATLFRFRLLPRIAGVNGFNHVPGNVVQGAC
jgi:hypothetical protein